jgi:hypothetical protein
MTQPRGRFEFRYRRWVSTVFVMLILFAVCAQAVHIHADRERPGATCLACVSAHTGVTVASVVSSGFLVAVTFVFVLHEIEVPNCEAVLPLFIRPPPSR